MNVTTIEVKNREGEVIGSLRVPASDNGRPLTADQWSALAAMEKRIYHPDDGCNAWTDVSDNDGSPFLADLWDHAQMYAEQSYDSDDVKRMTKETARRVAAALAVLAFGTEQLLP